MKWGVPQGSVLGPILFNVYINDLFALPLRASVIGYADDTSLMYSGDKVKKLSEIIREDMELMALWFRNNYLHLNINKCKAVVYAYKTPDWIDSLRIKVGENVIEKVSEIKYLGLILDEKLTWQSHSEYLQAKLRNKNYLFYQLKNHLQKPYLKRIHKPLYESIMNYGIIHWGGSKHIKAIKVLQNKVARTILSLHPRTTESEIYPNLGAVGLEDLYKTRLLVFIFKNKRLFQLHNTEQVHTRRGGTMMSAYPKWIKFHSRLQARYRGYELYNALPVKIREERRLAAFKKQIREWVEMDG